MDQLGWLLEQIRTQWNWAPGSGFLNNSEITWWLTRNALLINDWAFRVSVADMPDYPSCNSGLEEMALHAFY